MTEKVVIEGEVSIFNLIDGDLSLFETIDGCADKVVYIDKYGDYEGEYVFTPSQSTQIVNTEKKGLAQNIVINPIPSNYGLITWNGSTLLVS